MIRLRRYLRAFFLKIVTNIGDHIASQVDLFGRRVPTIKFSTDRNYFNESRLNSNEN